MKIYQNYINGEWIDSASGEFSDVINPATEEVIAKVTSSNEADVDAAVDAANAAFPEWNEMGIRARKEYLERFYDKIVEHQQEIADTIVKELGTSRKFAEKAHVPLSVNEMRATLDDIDDFKFIDQIDNAIIQKLDNISCYIFRNFKCNHVYNFI